MATIAEGGIHRTHQYQQQQWKGRNNFGQRFQQQPRYQQQPKVDHFGIFLVDVS